MNVCAVVVSQLLLQCIVSGCKKFNYPQRVCTVVYGVGYSPSLPYYILLLTSIKKKNYKKIEKKVGMEYQKAYKQG